MTTAHSLLFVTMASFTLSAATKDSCLECHSVMEGRLQTPATLIVNDVHKASGLSCANCHGGDPTTDDMTQAMSRAKGFLGKVARTAIPKLCARCHSDPAMMRKYRPQLRVDQFELYQTSVHGKLLATGDDGVATCIDCHSVHDIRAVKDAQSPVHPLRLPATCARCHADKAKMAKYKIPTNQFASYQSSVHWNALKARGDLSAPNCASCHGNHGATPPQVSSVAAVCGSCHVLNEQLYDKSAHKAVFEGGSGGGGCVVCHGNHAIQKPSAAMLAGAQSICSPCHEEGSAGAKVATQAADWINGLESALKQSEGLLAQAENYGMEVSDAQIKLIDGKENLVKAQLALHAFNLDVMRKPVTEGMAIAAETRRAGEAALREKDNRRLGLAASVLFIAITIAALWLLIRRIEANPQTTPSS